MLECLVLGETVGVGGNEEGAVKWITEEKVTQISAKQSFNVFAIVQNDNIAFLSFNL